MIIVGAVLGSIGLISLLYGLVILAQFGRKLGAVTKMRPIYKGYYVAVALIGLGLIVRFIRASVFWAASAAIPPSLNDPRFYLVLYHLPIVVGMSLSLGITWHYWNWLLKER
jgi:hypothetical protein